MDTLTLIATAFGLGLLFGAAPGPVFAATVQVGVRGGYKPALAVQLGSIVGDGVWAVLGLAGVGVLLQLTSLRLAIGVASIAYLLWLAWQSWCASREEFSLEAKPGTHDTRRAWRTGALLSLTNPQNLAYWAAIGSVLGALGIDEPTFRDYAVYFAGFMLSSVVWAFLFAALVDRVLGGAGARYARIISRLRRGFLGPRARLVARPMAVDARGARRRAVGRVDARAREHGCLRSLRATHASAPRAGSGTAIPVAGCGSMTFRHPRRASSLRGQGLAGATRRGMALASPLDRQLFLQAITRAEFMNHLKLALRQLRLRAGLSFVVIAMLALGIGATTAMFSLYHQILLRPLPVPEPERLVNLAAPGPKPGGGIQDLGLGNREAQFSYPMFRDLEREQSGFTGIAAYVDYLANLSFEDRPTSGRIYLVSGSYFDVLGLKPALGRLLGPGDDPAVGESAVAVLSYEFWQRAFGGEPTVIGKALTVNGQSLEIVGIAPQGFRGTNIGVRTDVFVPLTLAPTAMAGLVGPRMFDTRQGYWIYLFARLKPGVTLDRAAAQLNGVYAGILNDVEAAQLNGPQLPDGTLERFRARQIEFAPGGQGQSVLAGQAAQPLVLLLGVTALVLLIVCVNIANLLLARGAARAGEMATRASLGASRAWLVRQLLTESFVLIAIGGLLSLVIAAVLVRLIAGLLPVGVAIGLAPGLSTTAMLFAAGASLVTVIVFGLVPALRVSDANPALAMRADAGRSGGSRAAMRFRGVLTTAQIAFSMLLLILAGLFTKSLMNVAGQDVGMDVESLVSFSVTPRMNAYGPEQLADYYDRVEEVLAAQPGVLAVGSAGVPLLGNFALRQPFSVEGFDAAPGADNTAAVAMVGTDFFGALGIPLRTGRTFTERDEAGSPPVVVVNESFARKFNVADVGKRVGFGTTTNYQFEIVGIVADAKLASVKGDFEPVIYLSRYQTAGGIQALFYYLRAGVEPDALLAMIPRVAAEIDPDVPVTNLATMTTAVNSNVYVDRLLSMLSAGFAALATLLAGIGLYGVLAYNVTQRTRELGLRLALGAPPARVRAMVLKQVGIMALIGAGVGLAGALAVGRAAESLLFGLSARDPAVFGAAVVVLGAVVLAGAWLPAHRASRIAPTEALRHA